MLKCWNEDFHKRPTFADLRAKFDALLLADRSDEYIDLRIDNEKPYYMLETSVTLAESGNLRSSPVPGNNSILLSEFANKELSPKPLPTPDFSPSHKSQQSSLSVHDQFSQTSKSCIAPANLSSNGTERRQGEQQNGRPASLLLPREQEKREMQNHYVDEPSRAALTKLALPPINGRCRTRGGSDGAIEMNNMTGRYSLAARKDENISYAEIQITIDSYEN